MAARHDGPVLVAPNVLEADLIRFRFELRPVAEVAPWGGERPTLSWFGLSDGWYWIELGDVDLLRYLPEDGEARPYVDYYVVRLWEDLLQLLPVATEDVPADLVDVLRSQLELGDLVDDALITWYSDHFLDVGYLRNAPGICCWREGSQVTISWRGSDPSLFAAPPSGEVTVGLPEFLAAVEEFHGAFIAAMEARVAEVVAAPPVGVGIDLAQLQAEHTDRATWLARAIAQTPATDWSQVRMEARRAALLPGGSSTIER